MAGFLRAGFGVGWDGFWVEVWGFWGGGLGIWGGTGWVCGLTGNILGLVELRWDMGGVELGFGGLFGLG